MTTIVFVRHAMTDGSAGDTGLSTDGHALAVAVAATLAERAVHAVYTSPLRRARETADHIATSFVDEMCARFPEATIIAVTHGGIVDDLLGGHEHWPHCGITELVN